MRQIKFRAWDESMGRMVFCPTLEYRKDGTVFSNNFDSYGKLVERPLMQFTGLHDANGVGIYEGDIVCHINLRIGMVEYIPEFCAYSANYSHYVTDQEAGMDLSESVVIGNIHQNPELLDPKE